MKLLSFLTILLSLFCINTNAEENNNLKMFEGINSTTRENGYLEPVYIPELKDDLLNDQFSIHLMAKPDNFPFSSTKQGSIFSKIFKDLFEKEHILVAINSFDRDFKQLESIFERGEFVNLGKYRGIINTYFKEYKYSKNEFLYPSIMENDVYFIVPVDKDLDVKEKQDLKKYKGIYVKQDNFSDFVLKDFSNLNIKEVESWDKAFELLMTAKADFMVGSYYPSHIALYKAGLREYVRYSTSPVWKMPMFIRLDPQTLNKPRILQLKRYLKGNRYKQLRDKEFSDLMEMYKENTKGVVPPQYINSSTPKETEVNN